MPACDLKKSIAPIHKKSITSKLFYRIDKDPAKAFSYCEESGVVDGVSLLLPGVVYWRRIT